MGLPASGKTTLSKALAEALNLPLINRDDIKVRILDAVGWGDREWSKKAGKASFNILDDIINQMILSKSSFIIESDFNPEFANEKFNTISKSGYKFIQIICTADPDIIISRWKHRAAHDKTHPSSTEGKQGLNELLEAISKGPRKPLDIPGEVMTIDTGSELHTLDFIHRVKDLI